MNFGVHLPQADLGQGLHSGAELRAWHGTGDQHRVTGGPHPVVLAKTIASLAVLSNRRVIAGLGPGSSFADYRAIGVPFDQRWARFDEGLRVVRALVRGEPAPDGEYYGGRRGAP